MNFMLYLLVGIFFALLSSLGRWLGERQLTGGAKVWNL